MAKKLQKKTFRVQIIRPDDNRGYYEIAPVGTVVSSAIGHVSPSYMTACIKHFEHLTKIKLPPGKLVKAIVTVELESK